MSQTEILGELRSTMNAGLTDALPRSVELGNIIAGVSKGRENDDQITVANLTGTGIQDTAIATFTYQLAQARGLGVDFAN